MSPGYYVTRLPKNGTGSRLVIESVRFLARSAADNWCDFVKDQHPKDDVFVITIEG